jgi:hypothetical protein
MMNRNIFNSDATCEIIIAEEWQSLIVNYHREGLRVISKDNMIKCEVFSAKKNTKFRVRMLIESISDEEERILAI